VVNTSIHQHLKDALRLPWEYVGQSDSWIDRKIFNHWFFHSDVPSVKEHFHKIGKNSYCYMIIAVHTLVNLNCSWDIFLLFTSSKCGTHYTFGPRSHTKCEVLLSARFPSHGGTVKQSHHNYNIRDAFFNIAREWNSVKTKPLFQAWRKLWPAIMIS
jgi:hypothetical protein